MQLMAPTVPPDVAALWTMGTAVLTTAIVQLLKKFISPIHNAPDGLKALLAFLVALSATEVGHFVGGPVPNTLEGVVGVVVSWLSSMGAHRLALVLGLVKPTTPA